MGDLGPLSGSGTQSLTSPIPGMPREWIPIQESVAAWDQPRCICKCAASANVLLPHLVSFLTKHLVCVCVCVCVCACVCVCVSQAQENPLPKKVNFSFLRLRYPQLDWDSNPGPPDLRASPEYSSAFPPSLCYLQQSP